MELMLLYFLCFYSMLDNLRPLSKSWYLFLHIHVKTLKINYGIGAFASLNWSAIKTLIKKQINTKPNLKILKNI